MTDDQVNVLEAPSLVAAPNRTYWLDTLGVAQFPSIMDLQGNPLKLREMLLDVWKSEIAFAEATLKSHGNAEPVLLNLILLGTFTGEKRGEVIRDIARVHLGDELVENNHIFDGRLSRREAATLLFSRDPNSLWDIELWEHWHDRKRCSFDLVESKAHGHVDIDSDWNTYAMKALAVIGGDKRGAKFCRAIVRSWENDVFLAFRQVGQLDKLRNSEGLITIGYRDDWTFVRFYAEWSRIDVVSDDMENAVKLSQAICSSVLKRQCIIQHARDPLTWNRLDEFLKIICEPDDDRFRLLEIVANGRGLWRTPIIRVSNTGKERVEKAVASLRNVLTYAQTAKDVRSVKIGFQHKSHDYRIELHFPDPIDADDDQNIVLCYTDTSGHKDVAEQFERLVRSVLGVSIHPKASKRAVKRKQAKPRPKQRGKSFWTALLKPEHRDPADWELEELEALRKQGLIRYKKSIIFQCGEPLISHAHRPPGTVDCPGLVTLPYAPVSERDPFEQNPDEEFRCDTCDTLWRLNRFSPPLQLRVISELLQAGVSKYLGELLTKCSGRFEDSRKGYWTRSRSGGIDHVVLVGVSPERFLQNDFAQYHPTCWCGLTGSDVAAYGERGVSLPMLLADRHKAIEKVLKLGALTDGTESARPSSRGAQASDTDDEMASADEYAHTIVATPKTVKLRDRDILGSRDQRSRLLIAMLNENARRDENEDPPVVRRFRPASRLLAHDAENEMSDYDIHTWTNRARKAINDAFPDKDLGTKIIETSDAGIRLGEGYRCEGFSLAKELENYRKAVKRGRKGNS